MKQIVFTFSLVAMMLLLACNKQHTEQNIMNQTDFPQPPVAAIQPDTFTNFGQIRVDNYYWLKDKSNPKVIDYIKTENEYTDSVMAATADLQQTIYSEILGRIKEDDQSYPVLKRGYYYYSRTEKGKQYEVYLRKKGSQKATEEVVFDLNKMAERKPAFIFGGYSVSPDNSKAAYFYNESGSFAEFTLKIKDLASGEDVGFTVKGATSVAWSTDNKTVFYSVIDNTLRSYRVYRQQLDEKQGTLVYEEKDAKFSTYVQNDKNNSYVLISSQSSTTSEEQFLRAEAPTDDFTMFRPRQQDVEYSIYPHNEFFFVRYKNKENLNGKIYQVPINTYNDMTTWKEFVAHNKNIRIERLDILNDYVAIQLRKKGLAEIEIKPIDGGKPQMISFPEPVYSATLRGNPEYNQTTIRYSYNSLNRPNTLYEYDIKTDKSTVLKVQDIPSGFSPDKYEVERLWATAQDGTQVPMAIIHKKGMKKDGANPALIYSYGSYGISSDVGFISSFYSLIDRGFVFAIAQVRGGSDLGEQWYEDGRLLKKKNTFTDFIACSEKLIADGYTSANKLAAMGGSAGGLLMGAVANTNPDLYQTIVAQVPFVDVINTMLDPTLPLTTGEYEEWGDPNVEAYYNYILSYSPYDNIGAQDYPNILVTGGINDSQVLFHEPTKYVAKLRSLKTDNNLLLLHMNMDSGHGGATGRYDGIKDTAFEFAFILNRVGINK